MKILSVPKPIPHEAIVQVQKNMLMRKINALENSSDKNDYEKAMVLKERLKELEISRETKKNIEKEQLSKMYYEEDKKVFEDKEDLKENDEANSINIQKTNKDKNRVKIKKYTLGGRLDKRL